MVCASYHDYSDWLRLRLYSVVVILTEDAYQVRAESLRKNDFWATRLVSGHDLGRAEKAHKIVASAPVGLGSPTCAAFAHFGVPKFGETNLASAPVGPGSPARAVFLGCA